MQQQPVKAPEVKKGRAEWWPPRLGRQPLVETRTLTACAADPACRDHMELLARWFSDTELGKWMEAGDDDGETDGYSADRLAKSFADDYADGSARHGDVYLLFFERSSGGAAVGFGAVYGWTPAIARAEISFMIGEAPFRGRGLGKEVVGALCEFAFGKMGALSLFSSVVLENVPSRKAMERCGFAAIGVRHRAHSHGGVLHDETLMECFPESYAALRDAETRLF